MSEKVSAENRVREIRRKRKCGLCWKDCEVKRASQRCADAKGFHRICITGGARTSWRRGRNGWLGLRHSPELTHLCSPRLTHRQEN